MQLERIKIRSQLSTHSSQNPQKQQDCLFDSPRSLDDMALHWIFHEHELNQSDSNTSTVQKQIQLSHSWNTMTNVLSTSSRHPLFSFADAADMGS